MNRFMFQKTYKEQCNSLRWEGELARIGASSVCTCHKTVQVRPSHASGNVQIRASIFSDHVRDIGAYANTIAVLINADSLD